VPATYPKTLASTSSFIHVCRLSQAAVVRKNPFQTQNAILPAILVLGHCARGGGHQRAVDSVEPAWGYHAVALVRSILWTTAIPKTQS